MKKHVVLAVILTCIVSSACGCIMDGEKKTVTMTMLEFANDYSEKWDNDTRKITGVFNSLENGDTLIIRDMVNDVIYNEQSESTLIDFETLVGTPLTIEGDITDTFKKGDHVELTLHIISITLTQIDTNTGEIWVIELEALKEEWDSKNNTYIPIAQEHIRFSETEQGTVITMTMEEFIEGYEQSVENDNKKMSYLHKSLNHGDTLIINDTANDVSYNESSNYTMIDFETLVGTPLTIDGDITDTFKKGDRVELTLQIIKVIFTKQYVYTDEIWTFEQETFKEGWDSKNSIFIPIPQEYIRHAKGEK